MKASLLQSYWRPQAALGLTLESSQLVVSLVRRNNGGTRLSKTFTVPIGAESVLTEPEKVGQELALHLHRAEIRVKRCAVCLPPGWALTAPVELPPVSPDDLSGFLELRAEREFPLPPSELHLSHSVVWLPDGRSQATLAAIPSRRFEAVSRMLAAAGCRVASISLGIDQCLEGAERGGSINFLPNRSHLDLVICAGGGVAAVRSLPAVPTAAEEAESDTARTLRRELRVTLGRLPDLLRRQISQARCFGGGGLRAQTRQWFGETLSQLGITEWASDRPVSADEAAQGALAEEGGPGFLAASRHLMGRPVVFEFVPPQVSKLESALRSLSKGRKRRLGLVAGGLALLLIVPILWRSHQERRLTAAWDGMKAQVAELEALQDNIRQYRPWFASDSLSLHALEALTLAFPEEGSVWGRVVELKDDGRITCSGFARSQTAFMEMLDRLRAQPGVRELQVQQVRGDNPLQFTVVFLFQHERKD